MKNIPMVKIKYALRMGAVSGLMVSGLMLSSTALTAQEAPNVPLQPDQRAKVQAVGQSLIQAMRSAEPAQDREAIVAQIKSIKQQVDLMATLDTSSSLTLQGQTSVQSLSAQRQTKTDQAMNTLRARLNTLKGDTQSLRDQEQKAEPTMWQRITRFLVQAETAAEPRNRVVKPLSVQAITTLDNVDSEVEAAMALPAQERHEKFKALSAQLTLSKKPVQDDNTSGDITRSNVVTMDGEAYTAPAKETPTFQIRTKHRRTFSLDN